MESLENIMGSIENIEPELEEVRPRPYTVEEILSMGPTSLRLLIEGEKGTGKSTVAGSFAEYCLETDSKMKFIDADNRGAFTILKELEKRLRERIDHVCVYNWGELVREISDADEDAYSILIIDSMGPFKAFALEHIKKTVAGKKKFPLYDQTIKVPSKSLDNILFESWSIGLLDYYATDMERYLLGEICRKNNKIIICTTRLFRQDGGGEARLVGLWDVEFYFDAILKTLKTGVLPGKRGKRPKDRKDFMRPTKYNYFGKLMAVRGKKSVLEIPNPIYKNLRDYLPLPL